MFCILFYYGSIRWCHTHLVVHRATWLHVFLRKYHPFVGLYPKAYDGFYYKADRCESAQSVRLRLVESLETDLKQQHASTTEKIQNDPLK